MVLNMAVNTDHAFLKNSLQHGTEGERENTRFCKSDIFLGIYARFTGIGFGFALVNSRIRLFTSLLPPDSKVGPHPYKLVLGPLDQVLDLPLNLIFTSSKKGNCTILWVFLSQSLNGQFPNRWPVYVQSLFPLCQRSRFTLLEYMCSCLQMRWVGQNNIERLTYG